MQETYRTYPDGKFSTERWHMDIGDLWIEMLTIRVEIRMYPAEPRHLS